MHTQPTAGGSLIGAHRVRCYGCYRPERECFCDAIPTIDNRTDTLILQHVRERSHAFNTARLVRKALKNSTLLVGHTRELAEVALPLKPRAGLLYPGPGAALISDLRPDQRPEQLVVLDGTWHHAKTLMRDLKALHDLPRYQLVPASPGRYRIRLEPSPTCLSTLEATVAALRLLEPDTRGFDQLLRSFDCMVERQLAHPKVQYARRHKRERSRVSKRIPGALVRDPNDIVVAYGESAPSVRGRKRASRPPVYWAAERLGTGERFACAVGPELSLPDRFLDHLQLTREDFAGALSPSEFRASWAEFLRSGDQLAVYHPSTSRLLAHVHADFAPCLVLKSIDFNPERYYSTLEEACEGEELEIERARHPGRAGNRLAQAVALVRYLHALKAKKGT